MPILTELVVSIVGGVATALILGALVRPTSSDISTTTKRSSSLLGDFMHLLISVGGGIAIAMLLGRHLIQAGIMPKGVGGRLARLVGGTALLWFLMLPLRRR